VVGGKAAYHGRKNVCREGFTFPTPLCVLPQARTQRNKEAIMADNVTVWLEYVVVHTPTAQGTAFEPNEASIDFQVNQLASRSQSDIQADQSVFVLCGIRPDPDGHYQLLRRKQQIMLQSDATDQSFRLLQLTLKIRFGTGRKAAVAVYPITSDLELADADLEKKTDWILLLARGQPGGGIAGDVLYKIRRVTGGGALPPCTDPNISCKPPRSAHERVICGMHGCS
jgi:hypothetical protein